MAIVIAGLVVAGVTAFPLETELRWVAKWFTADNYIGRWFWNVNTAIQETNQQYPFLAYGTDWLAFAHLVIAIVFIGPLRDPVRNKWVIQFGLIACAAIVPLAFIAGEVRGIPVFWRLVDTSFGVVAAMPLWIALRAVLNIERLKHPYPQFA